MTHQAKVLLVDDDAAFREAAAMMLEAKGLQVFTAEDARTGLAAAREHKPDVVIADVIMERPDAGFALARAIRADAALADVKLVMLTAAGEQYQMLFEPDEQWLPVEKVLEKPIDIDELLAEISKLVADPSGREDST